MHGEEIKLFFKLKILNIQKFLINEFVEINDIYVADFFGCNLYQNYGYDYYENDDFDYEDFSSISILFESIKIIMKFQEF